MTSKYTQERVISLKRISDNLFCFTLTRPKSFKFTAGQFVRIGIDAECGHIRATDHNPDGLERIFRAYSVVSSPFAETLEFFSVVVPGGAFTSRLQHISVGAHLYLEKIPYGFLTLARFQKPKPSTLWLMATGTGVAPFLSILQTFDVWQNYRDIVLVYSARTKQDLGYETTIANLKQTFGEGGAHFHFLPVVTREPVEKSGARFHQRITELIVNQKLTQATGVLLDDTCHVMLCGNPQMIEDAKQALKQIGLRMNRRGEGNIAVENYW